MSYDVLVYGPVFCDLIFTDLPAMPELGKELFAGDFTATVGGSAIVAAGLHRLGSRVGLIAELGNDPLSAIIGQTLDQIGLDRALIREHPHPLPQVTVGLAFPHDRAFITRFARPASPPDLAAILARYPARHLHVCSFLSVLETPDVCRLAHAAGLTVSFDPGWDEQALHETRTARVIAEADLFLPNQEELCHIARSERVDEAVSVVQDAQKQGTLIVKAGAQGATAYLPDGSPEIHVATLPITPVDTTGAGDAFDAGLLHALVQGLPLETSMRYGAVCGGLATTAPGGITALPTLEEMHKWLPKLPS
jgi:sugar/nucleoside kinase (ribokinase family)